MADSELHKGAAKTARIPIKIVPKPRMRLPAWIKAEAPSSGEVRELKAILREAKLIGRAHV
jgi:lipoic acid synthetase